MFQPRNVAELADAVLAGACGPSPQEMLATSAFWLYHGTRLAGGRATHLNHCLLVRSGRSFGACSFEAGDLDYGICADASGRPLDELIRGYPLPVRIAALDAYLAEVRPHRSATEAEPVTLPAGAPETRAETRDSAIAGLLDIEPEAKVALIGVVNPLIAAIRDRGGVCLPCDFNVRRTQWDDPVTQLMDDVLDAADAVVATGMTLGNGTFDVLVEHCRRRNVPLVIYAQTGSALVRGFLGAGVTALCAEPFPFSHCSAESTVLYRYRG
jgi:Putative heavy-metal chelation